MKQKLEQRKQDINRIEGYISKLKELKKDYINNMEKELWTSEINGLEKELLKLQTEEVY